MGQPIQRISRPAEEDSQRRSADRARLLERIAIGLAHEGKNPLHNMALHLQLMSEKLASPERQSGSPIEKHVAALREGIGRVDALLRAFGEFASPAHLVPDLAAAVGRAVRLFSYDIRRATVKVSQRGPAALPVRSGSTALGDLVAHAFLACLELARDGGAIDLQVERRGAADVLEVRAGGGAGNREQAQPHLDAVRLGLYEADERAWAQTAAPGAAIIDLAAAAGNAASLAPLIHAAAGRLAVAITTEGGIGHLMATRNLPLITLAGPTNAIKWKPVTETWRRIASQDFGSRHMEEIPVDAVLNAVAELARTGA